MKPNTKITLIGAKKTSPAYADRAGMLRIPMNGEEKICVAKAR